MSDDRFSDPNTFKPASGRISNGMTLEDFMRAELLAGREETVLSLLRSLPEERREHYRKIWAELKASQRPAGKTR